jgi:hypothetical protein
MLQLTYHVMYVTPTRLLLLLLQQCLMHVLCASCAVLLQVPLRLGVLGCSLVADQLYKAGPWLVMAYAMTVVQLLGPLGRLCQSDPKGSVLVAPAQQQLIDSGLVTCLQTLAEAAATQLERCTAAAAAVPA